MATPGGTDALLRMVRWLAAAFVLLQLALYTPPPGMDLPFARWVGALAAVPLVLLNVVSLLAGPRLVRRSPRAWVVAQLAVDSAVALSLVVLFTFDTTSALWAVLVLPVLEGALTAGRRGAVRTWAALTGAYVLRELWATVHYDHVLYPDSVTYRTGILFIVALATGSLAQRLATQVAEGDALRRVAVATRRMSTLHEAEVLRQVLGAAAAAGFGPVRLLLPHPAGGWRSSSAGSGDAPTDVLTPDCWLPSQAVAVALTDPEAVATVLPATDLAWLRSGHREAQVVVAPLHGPDAVLAVLVAEHEGPVPARQIEALELLAAHAAVAVGNARLHEERRAIEGVLAHQAVHDSLTELANRRLLQDRATQVLADRGRDGDTVAVLLLDLDGFKEINDTFGHSYGDGLLRQVATRLAATVRTTDTAARLGGDEFALLVSGLEDRADAERTAARVQDALQQPFLVDGITLDVEGSVGVALAPDHGHDIDSLLRCADVAMYAAKRDRVGVTVYDPGFDQHTPDRLALLGDLRRALDDPSQLQLHYQPKVDLALGGLVGVEALLRWRHPERGMVPPAEFIGTAEGTGLIHPLTRHVLDTALAQARQWQDEGQWVPVAVNLSARSLVDVSLTGHIADLLAKHQVPAALLRLEITETSIMADPGRALDVLHGLATQGVRLSIDDFGTGYSSMNYLRLFPVDELKVDRSFVSQICTQSNDTVVVRSMIELGHNLGMHVVAEGVEDQETLTALGELGCDIVQGYFTGRPMPAADLARWLEDNLGRRGTVPQPAG